jgi:hypothetical protein
MSSRKGRTATAVRKSIPRNYVDLPPLVSIESTEACMPIDNLQQSPGQACNDGDIIQLLILKHKLLLEGDVNEKYTFWNNILSNP